MSLRLDTLSSQVAGTVVARTVSAAWNPSEAWAARSHGPVSITTQPGVVPEGFASPLHKHIRLGGSVVLQRSSQPAASTHTGLLSFGLLQLPMPAALCPVPRSSGSHRLPLPSWGHPHLNMHLAHSPKPVVQQGPNPTLQSTRSPDTSQRLDRRKRKQRAKQGPKVCSLPQNSRAGHVLTPDPQNVTVFGIR